MRSEPKPPLHLAHTQVPKAIVPKAPLANALDGTLEDFQIQEQQTNPEHWEQSLILALAYRLDAKCIFEFGPLATSRSAKLAPELGDEASTIVTNQSKSGEMASSRLHLAAILKPEAIARAEVIRHVDALHGPDARLAYAMYINECDLVIVEATHDYEYVRCDSLTALQLAKPGGVILWTDYGVAAGVTRCLNELYQTLPCLRTLRHISGTSLCIWRRGD